jgi:type IV secretory pathway VirB6-like protein
MKKLLTLLFTAVLAFSLAMPVFAQDQSQSETPKTETGKKKKKADAAPAGDSQ